MMAVAKRAGRAARTAAVLRAAAGGATALCVLVTAAGAATAQPQPRDGGTGPSIVHCHDAERGIVERTLPHRCEGRIVSAEEAARIKLERRRERARRLQQQPDAPTRGTPQVSYGSAFPVGGPELFLTARHTVESCNRITLATAAGTRVEAEILAAADDRDIALLSAPLALAPFSLASEPPAIGSTAKAIGYPNQGLPVLRPLTFPAEILNRGTPAKRGLMLAFKGAIRAGASGGPLLAPEGTVLGMIVTRLDTPTVFAKTGRMLRDVNFAIDATQLSDFLKRHAPNAPPQPATATSENAENRVLRVLCDY